MYDLASVKAWLGLPAAADPILDPQIQALMDRALDAVQRELDWYFGTSRSAMEVLDGTGNRTLWLRQPPLGGVVVSDRTGVGIGWAVVDAGDYENSERALFGVGNWTRGLQNYRVVYDEGFIIMPGDIEQLLLDIVNAKWSGRDVNPGMKSEKIGDYSYTRGDLEDSAHWGSVVMRWRRGRI